jgi:Tol biopolymer transport system component
MVRGKVIGGRTDDFAPAWSPDGTLLGFVRWIDPASDEPEALPQIWTTDVDAARMRQLTEHEDGIFRFDWALDGSAITFGSACKLFVVDISNGEPRHLRMGPDWDDDQLCPFDPQWTADGERIMFAAGPDDDHDLYVVRIDGTGLERFRRPGATDNEPDWHTSA